MKKLILILFLVVAGGGAFYYFQVLRKDRNIDITDLPPSGAVWVYESEQAVQDWNQLISYPFWKNISGIPFFRTIEAQFEKLDSLAGRGGALDKVLRSNKLLVSCHIASQNALDYVFYFKLWETHDYATLRTIVERFEDDPNYRVNSRKFSGYEINEVAGKPGGETFSWVFINDHFVGSFSPFLVEDVIRNVETKSRNGFFHENGNPFNAIASDNGNLFINIGQFAAYLDVFAGGNPGGLRKLSHFGESTFLDFEMERNYMLFNGISYAPVDSGAYFLNVFRHQQAGPLSIQHLVPNRTACLFQYTVSDPAGWQNDLDAYWEKNDPAQRKLRRDFEAAYQTNLPEFTDWISGVGQAVIESIDPGKPDQLIYISPKDLNEGLNHFNKLAEWSAEQKGDTVYSESFGDMTIGMIDMPDLPAILFGPLFSGFNGVYYTAYGGLLVLAESPSSLKALVSDVETENVWGKSGKHTRFLENVLPESNISLTIDLEKSWNMLLHNLHPSWKQAFMENAFPIQAFEFLALQFNQVDNRFYTSLIAYVDDSERQAAPQDLLTVERQSITDAPIITRPFLVRNFADRSYETIVQDSLNQLYLFSKGGELVWKLQMQDSVVSDIYQVDYYQNGRRQYLYADKRSIKLIDREGRFVPGFPLYFPDSIRIRSLSLIDYDNTKNYRMLIADQKGKLFMFNMKKENLEGWNPLVLGSPVAYEPEHIRVRGRDCIIAVEEKGIVHVFNRRGEHYNGFPVDIESPIAGTLFIESGSAFENTTLTAVNQLGKVIRFNLDGSTVSSNQLYKPSAGAQFLLCPDAMKKTYVIARQDFNRLSILNSNGDTLLEKDYITSDNLSVQYYYYSLQNQVYAVTDKTQEFTYLYDETGRLIGSQPLESSGKIGLIFTESEKLFQVYSCYGNTLTVSRFHQQ